MRIEVLITLRLFRTHARTLPREAKTPLLLPELFEALPFSVVEGMHKSLLAILFLWGPHYLLLGVTSAQPFAS